VGASVTGDPVGASVTGDPVGVLVAAAEGSGVGSLVVGELVGAADIVGETERVGLLVGGAVTVTVGAGEIVGASHVFTHKRQSLPRPDPCNAVAVKKVKADSLQLSSCTAQCSNENSPGLKTLTQAPT